MEESTRLRIYEEIKKLVNDIHVFTKHSEYEKFIRRLSNILEV